VKVLRQGVPRSCTSIRRHRVAPSLIEDPERLDLRPGSSGWRRGAPVQAVNVHRYHDRRETSVRRVRKRQRGGDDPALAHWASWKLPCATTGGSTVLSAATRSSLVTAAGVDPPEPKSPSPPACQLELSRPQTLQAFHRLLC
jgi:hypothetical protein